jgi:hypothetical protein
MPSSSAARGYEGSSGASLADPLIGDLVIGGERASFSYAM